MNKRLREFEKESKLEIFGLGARRDKWETALEKYAELIVQECIDKVEVWETDSRNHISYMLKQHFGVEKSKGWVCPKCGIDRTKDVCPKGHSAAITGECPMTAEAQ